MMKRLRKIIILLAWLCLLEGAAMLVHNEILLVGPVAILKRLGELIITADFYRICLYSLGRILLGMGLALFFGIAIGVINYKSEIADEILAPALAIMKSIPVASFVVLLLIWQGSEALSVWVSFFVVFPNICVCVKNGLQAIEENLLEMSQVYYVRGVKKFLFIDRPVLLSYLIATLESSIGMSFKSGVAAEVIGTPDFSIGERIYVSKVYLDTAGLFAWTLSLIVLSYVAEKVILYLLRCAKRPLKEIEESNVHKEKAAVEDEKEAENTGLELDQVTKTYGDNIILNRIDKRFDKGGCYILMAPSGRGKTTLFRAISGLEPLSDGEIKGNFFVSYMFQEDRLVDSELTINNILLMDQELTGLHKAKQISEIASELLPKECLKQPVKELSGGMKRRVALIRAMLYLYEKKDAVCLLDEPFSGLDLETKKKAVDFIKKYQNGRTILLATHDEEDVNLLGGILWRM